MQRTGRNLRAAGVGALMVPLCLATLHAMARPPRVPHTVKPHGTSLYTVEDVGFRLVASGSGPDIGEFFPGINDDGAVASGSDTAVATGSLRGRPPRARAKKNWVLAPFSLYGGSGSTAASSRGARPRVVGSPGEFHAFKASPD